MIPGIIAMRAADEAEANVGVVEEGDNRGVAVETYQESCIPALPPGAPWCAAFCVYRIRNAAHDLGMEIRDDWPRSGYCPDHVRWAKTEGLWTVVSMARAKPSRVQRGDLALFYFSALHRHAHIGIVVSVHQWGVYTVEGNTGPESGEVVNRDGDGVYRKRRDWGELGIMGGFIRLPF